MSGKAPIDNNEGKSKALIEAEKVLSA